ncbi:ABC transporter substrate-binding protein [Arthrobacter bambusae]|uniref:ABC transporter substrate-binding protein n=1 Tax=Arthrobacter bambusae TaxID=1338426 RepID=UPI00278258E2|nr:ABC transporter substrate-binding protein [Arthrobacter bambusae]MDQ0239549.1 NitT/TauT family transport system substrate-binding protein [Arthrobacter bambusae]
MKNLNKNAVAGIIGASLLALTACGGTAASDTASATHKITVTVSPIVDVAPLYLAQQQGFFKEKNLDVTINVAPTSGARIPSLVSGSAQFALIGTADMLQAVAAGVPLRAVGVTTVTTNVPANDTGKVYVKGTGSIKSPADLNGHTIAVGSLGGGGELSLRAALDQAGADSSKIKFLEMPLDSMPNGLQNGQVDAISSIAPFTAAAEASGARYLMSPGAISTPGAAQEPVVAAQDYLAKEPNTVKDFIGALAKGTDYAAQHPDAVRKILPTFSKTPQALADTMQLPVFQSHLTKAQVAVWADLMLKYGFIKQKINVDDVVPQGAN